MFREIDSANDLTFMRLRTKKHEIMVAPDRDYLLLVVQNTHDNWKIKLKYYLPLKSGNPHYRITNFAINTYIISTYLIVFGLW